MQLPEQLTSAQVKLFLMDLQPLLESDRPRHVLDCSQIRQIDSEGIEMLLHCMDEAMKRNGDVKLAAVSPAAAVILELMRVDRLFEVFDTTEEAVRSFNAIPSYATPQAEPWYAGTYALGDLKVAS
jgi:anti-sigma B factor antagonist